jgi:hypothetical protein
MDIFEGAPCHPSSTSLDPPNPLADYQSLLSTAYTYLSPLLIPLLRLLSTTQSYLYATALPLLRPFLNHFAQLTQDSPAVVSLTVLLLAAYLSMRLLGLFQRLLAFGARLVVSVVFYGCLVFAALYVWQRGVERTVADLGGWAGEVQRVWVMEYGRWNEVQRQAQREAAARHGWR